MHMHNSRGVDQKKQKSIPTAGTDDKGTGKGEDSSSDGEYASIAMGPGTVQSTAG